MPSLAVRSGALSHLRRIINLQRREKSWNCWKYAKGFHRGSCHIFDRVLTAAILHGLEELLAGKDFEYEYRPPAAPKTISRLAELQSELARIATKEERIRLAYENGIDTLEEYKNNKLRLQKDRKRLEEAIRKRIWNGYRIKEARKGRNPFPDPYGV